MGTTLRAIRWLLDAALVLLVGTVVALVLAAQVGPMLGHRPVVIRGGSMEPAIPLGALEDVAHVEQADLAAGDVVTFEGANGVLVTHRINRIVQMPDGLYIETKGDANEHPDPVLVPASAITGRVDFSLPFLGFLMFMLTTLTGFASIVCLALTLLFAVLLLEDLEKEEREDLDGGIDPESEPAPRAGPWGDLIG
jgi:signal peptidase